MARSLVIYDSATGTIERMATVVASGAREAGGAAIVQKVDAVSVADLVKYDAIIVGSPCFFANVSASLKRFFDATYGMVGQLEGKVGGAFAGSESVGGGNELTLRSIHDFFMIHGMVIQGDPRRDHFGPVAVNPTGKAGDVFVDDDGECSRLGARVNMLADRLAPTREPVS
jgi:NAD(P)H dehydrogenase (quinone)